ncbi:MAG: isocitrate lyase/PEP mutase family protein [Vicinamibacterales bacterium]|jgi:methylisocitrate lyase|nr:isocitrate lyase/PEP mutase family protein [Vicinamibacterales bacterium]
MNDGTRRDFMQQAAALSGGIVAGAVPALAATSRQATSQTESRPMSKTSKLRDLLRRPDITVVPEAHSVFAARLAEINGFEAIYVGGNMMAAMYLGVEDWGLIQTSELVDIGGRIAGGVSVPAIVDADQGGETSLNAYRAVQAYERAGIAAFHVEDTLNPKHMGEGRSELMPLDEMLQRISAAVDGRSDQDFVIVCRTDCLILGPNRGETDEAIRRGVAFAEAGGDAFFVVGMRPEQAERIAREVPLPLISLNIPVPEARDAGVRVAIHAVQVYQPVMKLYETMILGLKEEGRFPRQERLSQETSAQVMRTAEYQRLAEQWSEIRR